MLYFTYPCLFCNYQFILLNPFPLFTSSPNPCGSPHFVPDIYESLSFGFFIYFVL